MTSLRAARASGGEMLIWRGYLFRTFPTASTSAFSIRVSIASRTGWETRLTLQRAPPQGPHVVGVDESYRNSNRSLSPVIEASCSGGCRQSFKGEHHVFTEHGLDRNPKMFADQARGFIHWCESSLTTAAKAGLFAVAGRRRSTSASIWAAMPTSGIGTCRRFVPAR
jgi:hypothetical protein